MASSYRMTDYFYAFRYFINDYQVLKLGGPSSVIELMCHPGHLAYQSETDVLLNLNKHLDGHYQLISYLDI